LQSEELAKKLNHLVIYRNLLKDALIQKLISILAHTAHEDAIYELAAGLIAKGEKHGLTGNLWQSYLVYLLARDENTFSSMVEKNRGQMGAGLRQAVLHDMELLQDFLHADLNCLQPLPFLHDFTPTTSNPTEEITLLGKFLLPPETKHSPTHLVEKLTQYYIRYGSGKTAGFVAFRWDSETGLVGIKYTDPIQLEDIIGYDHQKEVLIKNTQSFLADKPANNVLLVGARGTGKSSSVKGLVNRYASQGLRLMEVHKHQFIQLSKIIETLRGRSQKFIVFLDDLSFEDSEIEYKHLKSVIDGSIAAKADNVLLYATSNRRHLIKENWADRADNQDIHAADSVQEKISLSDRFGITLHFPAPDQTEYLSIVFALAERQAIDLTPEELRKRALRWEMSHSGRSGRLAQQFIKHLLGNN
jgi:predicted AAA+ superfamily ATPase